MKETLEKVAAEGLNMSRMNDIVGRRLQKTLNELESNPHNTLSNTLIWYFLYGQDQVSRCLPAEERAYDAGGRGGLFFRHCMCIFGRPA
jgi:hypothetical protein